VISHGENRKMKRREEKRREEKRREEDIINLVRVKALIP
jgi:hypothetical protein